MNVSNLIQKIHINGIDLCVEDDSLCVNSTSPLNDEQRRYLRQHKTEILQYLVHLDAVNQSKKRYVYRFTLINNQGGGTYMTDCPPNEAKQELIDMFIGREVESMELLNKQWYLH